MRLPKTSFAPFLTVTSNMLLTGLTSFPSSSSGVNGIAVLLSIILTRDPCRLCLVSSRVQFISRIDVAIRPSSNILPLMAKWESPNLARPCSGRCSGDVWDCNWNFAFISFLMIQFLTFKQKSKILLPSLSLQWTNWWWNCPLKIQTSGKYEFASAPVDLQCWTPSWTTQCLLWLSIKIHELQLIKISILSTESSLVFWITSDDCDFAWDVALRMCGSSNVSPRFSCSTLRAVV